VIPSNEAEVGALERQFPGLSAWLASRLHSSGGENPDEVQSDRMDGSAVPVEGESYRQRQRPAIFLLDENVSATVTSRLAAGWSLGRGNTLGPSF
jgi:hypothetical protein